MSPEKFSYLNAHDQVQAHELARSIARRDWVLFVGSGVSRQSGLPLWKDLAELMRPQLNLGNGNEIQDPLEIASLFSANLGRNALVQFLRDKLQTLGLSPNRLHSLLLDLHPSTIITTNVDDLFERALAQRGFPCIPVVTDADLSLTQDRLQVLKPHGDLGHPDSLVFTRRDYARYPQQVLINMRLCTLAAQHPFLFVGYSLQDPDLEHQFQKVLDAQGELAHYHYLVTDRVLDLQRRALLERHVQVIALGSYDRLPLFLEDLRTEAERCRESASSVQPINVARSVESLELEAADHALLNLLEEDYTPVIEALNQLRLVDAEQHLRRLLKRVQQVGGDPAFTRTPALRDFHQRILLALAAVAAKRRSLVAARALYAEAEALQALSGRRRLQAAEVLLLLGENERVEELLAESSEAQEGRGKEVLGLLALLRNDEARFRALYPQDENPQLEFAILRARLALDSSDEKTALKAVALLDTAWNLSLDFPHGLLAVAELTDRLLRCIVAEEWHAPEIDRKELIRTVRERYQKVSATFEELRDQYPEGLVDTLARLLDFHRALRETEAQQALLARLQSLPCVTRERAFAEHFAGGPPPTIEVIESLFQSGHLSGGEKALLVGAVLARAGRLAEAEQVYRQALAGSASPEERRPLVESLVGLLLNQERYDESLALVEEVTESQDLLRAMMRGRVFSHRRDYANAIVTLRTAVQQHPRNVFILENLVRFLIRPVGAGSATTPAITQEHHQALTEALQYTESLETLLPSFEHRLLRAHVLENLGRFEEALAIVEDVNGEGYVTLQTIQLRCDLLRKLGRNREIAELLSAHRNQYPDDYTLRFNEATAWAHVGEIQRAVAIWEELRSHQAAGSDLYRNLILAYIQWRALDPGALSRAFDLAKEALEKFPDRKDLAPLLLEAALGSGRSREAWEILGRRPDLQEGPYLRRLPEEQAITAYAQELENLRLIDSYYRAGGVPFSVYFARSPRPAIFLWQTPPRALAPEGTGVAPSAGCRPYRVGPARWGSDRGSNLS